MSQESITFKKIPSSVAFQRNAIVSDASMYSVLKDGSIHPVKVVRHGIRGTQNVYKGDKKSSGDTSGSVEASEVRNLQMTDSAKLDQSASAFIVEFSFALLDLKHAVTSIAPGKGDDDEFIASFKQSIHGFIERVKESEGAADVANRYARNLLNGRWLFRNRLIAESIKIEILKNDQVVAKSNALDIPLSHFNEYSSDEIKIGEELLKGLQGKTKTCLKVRATLTPIGEGSIEIFPSQNYCESKPKGFSRSLYVLSGTHERENKDSNIQGYAGIRDQKINNALRTIDTWYPSESSLPRPIPVEPLGANLDDQKFYRTVQTSSFKLINRLNDLDPDSDEGKFFIACLIRGGVYTEGKKK